MIDGTGVEETGIALLVERAMHAEHLRVSARYILRR